MQTAHVDRLRYELPFCHSYATASRGIDRIASDGRAGIRFLGSQHASLQGWRLLFHLPIRWSSVNTWRYIIVTRYRARKGKKTLKVYRMQTKERNGIISLHAKDRTTRTLTRLLSRANRRDCRHINGIALLQKPRGTDRGYNEHGRQQHMSRIPLWCTHQRWSRDRCSEHEGLHVAVHFSRHVCIGNERG